MSTWDGRPRPWMLPKRKPEAMDEKSEQPLVATVIGTCRVHRPFQYLEKVGLAIVQNRRASHYLHTTKEALQYLRYLQGEEVVPDELAPYVTAGNLKIPGPTMKAFESDIFIIEVSSHKEIDYHGIYLQLNYLMTKFFMQRTEIWEWWNLLIRMARTGKNNVMDGLNLPSYLNDFEKRLFKKINLKFQSPDDLIADMKKISILVDSPILFATHADVLGSDGKPIVPRQKWIDEVEGVAGKLGYPCFNPKALLMEYGQEFAMEKQGKDANHYTEEFYRIVGMEIFEIIKKIEL